MKASRQRGARPCRVASFLTRAFPDPEARGALLGDLNEVYSCSSSTGRFAWLWYWCQVALIVVHGLSERGRDFSPGRLVRPFLGLRQELSLTLRLLRRHWALTLSAVLVMGLGLGMNLLVIGLTESTVLADFPYPQSERLLLLKGRWKDFPRETLSLPEVDDYRQGCQACQEVGAYRPGITLAMEQSGQALPAQAAFVTPSYFRALGMAAQHGRTFSQESDVEAAAGALAVVSHDFWRRSLSASPSTVGSGIRLSGRRFEILGVMPPDFLDLNSLLPWEGGHLAARPVDVWLPLSASGPFLGPQTRKSRWTREYRAVVRLKAEAQAQEASEQLRATARRLREDYPGAHEDWSVRLVDLDGHFHATTRRALPLLLAGSIMLLLMCGVNLGAVSHVLTRSQSRPLTVSLALGAGRSRLLRRLALQVGVLSLAGAALAALLWQAALKAAAWWSTSLASASGSIETDWKSAGLIFALLTACAAVGALKPALSLTSRPGPVRSNILNQGGARRRRGSAVIVLEVAAAVMLVVTAGLMIKSIYRLSATPLGFNPERLLTFRLDLSDAAASQDNYQQRLKRVAFVRRLLQRTRDLEEVDSAAMIAPNALGQAAWLIGLTPSRLDPTQAANRSWPQRIVVTPGAFSALGLRVLEGRGFTDSDRMGSEPVAVIDESLARKHWPGQSALGKQFYSTHERRWRRTVVGVVTKAKHRGRLADEIGDVYLPYYQTPWQRVSAAVRMRGDPQVLTQRIREVARQVMPEAVPFDFMTMHERLKRQESAPRLITVLLCGYAALTMLLGLLGIVGILTHTVLRRRREIALRGALGASRQSIAWWILRRGFFALATGTLVGLAGGLSLSHLLRGFLYQVAPFDLSVHLGLSLTVLLLSLAACLPPALLASRINPMRVLRA